MRTVKNEKVKFYFKTNNIITLPVPYVLKQRIEGELQRMIKSGILALINVSEWASLIVPVIKKDRKMEQ